MGGVGGRGLILVIVWGYGVGVMRSLTGFMGMVDAVLSDSWVELGLGRGWFGSERSVGYCYYWIIGLILRGGEFLRVRVVGFEFDYGV